MKLAKSPNAPISCGGVCDAINSSCNFSIYDGTDRKTAWFVKKRKKKGKLKDHDRGGFARIEKNCNATTVVGVAGDGLPEV